MELAVAGASGALNTVAPLRRDAPIAPARMPAHAPRRSGMHRWVAWRAAAQSIVVHLLLLLLMGVAFNAVREASDATSQTIMIVNLQGQDLTQSPASAEAPSDHPPQQAPMTAAMAPAPSAPTEAQLQAGEQTPEPRQEADARTAATSASRTRAVETPDAPAAVDKPAADAEPRREARPEAETSVARTGAENARDETDLREAPAADASQAAASQGDPDALEAAGETASQQTATQGQVDELPWAYLWQVKRLLAEHRRYPRKAYGAGQQGTATVRIHLSRDGELLGAELLRGTGFPMLDEEARAVVERVGRFPPLPAKYLVGRGRFAIDQPIGFKIR